MRTGNTLGRIYNKRTKRWEGLPGEMLPPCEVEVPTKVEALDDVVGLAIKKCHEHCPSSEEAEEARDRRSPFPFA